MPLSGENTANTAISPIKITEKTIEHPQIFSRTGPAIWNGNLTSKGMWVSVPGHPPSEQVVLHNPTSDQTQNALLFGHSNRANNAPMILSHALARALKITANTPTLITVTAIRRETVAGE